MRAKKASKKSVKKPVGKPGRKRSLTAEQETQTCVRWLAGEDRQAMASDYGVHVNTISGVIKRAGLTAKDKKAAAEDPRLVKKNLSAYGKVPTADPKKPLDQIGWLFGTLMVSAQVVASEDFGGTEKERRKELLSHATVITKLIPPAALKAAKDKLTEDNEDMENGIGPGMEPVGD